MDETINAVAGWEVSLHSRSFLSRLAAAAALPTMGIQAAEIGSVLGANRQIYNYVRGEGESWELWDGIRRAPKLCGWRADEMEQCRRVAPRRADRNCQNAKLLTERIQC
jgi:hypothetical protein